MAKAKTEKKEADFTKPPFVEITYYGKSYPVNVGTPTGVLLFEYGREYYGFYRRGDKFFVHEDDLRARPDLFRGVIPDEPQAVTPPEPADAEPDTLEDADPVDNLSGEPSAKPARRKKL